MAISKVTFNGVTQMDVTQDSVSEENLLLGESATKANGERITGTLSFTTETVPSSFASGWGNSSSADQKAIKMRDNIVTVKGAVAKSSAIANNDTILTITDTNARPKETQYGHGMTGDGYPMVLIVGTDGTIKVRNTWASSTESQTILMEFTYII